MNTVRNTNIDILKGFACVGVILIHCSFPGIYGKFILYLGKFAVPVFFMISGYYLFAPTSSREYKLQALVRKAKHILTILLGAELFYLALTLAAGKDISQYVSNFVVKCFTGCFFGYQLWFLYALFYSYILLYIAVKLKIRLHCNYVLIGLVVLAVRILVYDTPHF